MSDKFREKDSESYIIIEPMPIAFAKQQGLPYFDDMVKDLQSHGAKVDASYTVTHKTNKQQEAIRNALLGYRY